MEKRPLKLFGKNTPFKIKVILTPEKVQDAHKILDLLLCYGLKKDFEWTEIFDKSIKNLAEALKHSYLGDIKNKALPKLLKQGMGHGIQRTLLSSMIKFLLYLKDHKNSSSKKNFQDFAVNVLSIKHNVQVAADEIDNEKKHLLNEYRTKIAAGSAILPIALVDIIVHYAISSFSLSHEIALIRQEENRALQFWSKATINQNNMERDIDNEMQNFIYRGATRHLETILGKEAHQILLEYLIENPNDPEFSANQTFGVKSSVR